MLKPERNHILAAIRSSIIPTIIMLIFLVVIIFQGRKAAYYLAAMVSFNLLFLFLSRDVNIIMRNIKIDVPSSANCMR